MRKPYCLIRSFTALLIILSFAGHSVLAQQQKLGLSGSVPAKDQPDAAATKKGPELTVLETEYSEFIRQRNVRAVFQPSNQLLQVYGNKVAVDITAGTDPAALLTELRALGLEQAAVFGKIISGLMPINRLQAMTDIPDLRFARPAYKPKNHSGLVKSQGDVALRSDQARSTFGVNGNGVKIGVLSDSYNNLGGETDGIQSGDLPGAGNPDGFTTPVQVLSDLAEGGMDEGRAMMEIIHDLAPGAGLAFHTAFGGQATFATGILNLRRAGCDVIVDDISYLAEPFFQDGIIAQAIDQVVRDGAVYFSAAGNENRLSYESAFVPGEASYIYGTAHTFAAGDNFQQISIPKKSSAAIVLQWDDPFYSYSTDGVGAATDLDVYLVDKDIATIVASSSYSNVGADPFEIIIFDNQTEDTLFNLLIEKYAGPAPKLMKYVIVSLSGPAPSILQHATFSPSLVGHPNAAGAIAVGAVRYDQTPAFGVDPPRVEAFSSVGGVPILFDTTGQRIEPLIRLKPEFTAPDGVNTTFFAPGVHFPDWDGFPNFFGTSAAAPHAAAVGALVLEAAGKNLSPEAVKEILQLSAIDMDDPFTEAFSEGFDFKTGAGFIQADRAIAQVQAPVESRVVSFTLIDTESNQELMTITDGAEINLLSLPGRWLNIRANTLPDTVGSVVFTLNDRQVTENIPPYAFAGDFGWESYKAINPPLSAGEYSLTAVPYAEARGQGQAGNGLTVQFRLVEEATLRFVLVSAETNEDIQPIEEGDVIVLSSLPASQLNIRAYTEPETVGSVRFTLNERAATENIFPYLLGGDKEGNYRALNPPLSPGTYSLEATAYTLRGATGTELGTHRVQFEVVREPLVARLGSPETTLLNETIRVYPNPAGNEITLQFRETAAGKADIQLINARGEVVQNYSAQVSPEANEARLNIASLPVGLYIVRVNHRQTLKLIKQ